MPRKPKTPGYQKGRTHLRRSITMSPQALDDYAAITAAHPDLMHLSAAIAWAGKIAREKISEKISGTT